MVVTLSRPQTLTERTAAPTGRVDRTAGVIYGVKLLGAESKNGRTYSEAAMRGAVHLYEGARVYVDHPREPGAARSVRDWAGVVENVAHRNGGLYGDLRLRREAPCYGEIIEAAESFSQSFGLSHNVEGRSTRRAGKVIVEEIIRVRSVDLVMDPATVRSLFEQYTPGGEVPPMPGNGEAEIFDDASLRQRILAILDAPGQDFEKIAKIRKAISRTAEPVAESYSSRDLLLAIRRRNARAAAPLIEGRIPAGLPSRLAEAASLRGTPADRLDAVRRVLGGADPKVLQEQIDRRDASQEQKQNPYPASYAEFIAAIKGARKR